MRKTASNGGERAADGNPPEPGEITGYRCAKCGKGLSFTTSTSDFQTPKKADRYPRLHRGKMYCYQCWCGFSRNRRNATWLAGEPVDW